jgi:hypothetical protein
MSKHWRLSSLAAAGLLVSGCAGVFSRQQMAPQTTEDFAGRADAITIVSSIAKNQKARVEQDIKRVRNFDIAANAYIKDVAAKGEKISKEGFQFITDIDAQNRSRLKVDLLGWYTTLITLCDHLPELNPKIGRKSSFRDACRNYRSDQLKLEK